MAFCGKCGTQIQDGAKFCPSCGAVGQEQTQTQAQINDVEANRIMAIIAYIGLLIIVPLVTGKYKNSPFLKFHVNQAIVFCIGYVFVTLLAIIPFTRLFSGILALGIAFLQIISIVGAIKGETKSFPVINGIKIIK